MINLRNILVPLCLSTIVLASAQDLKVQEQKGKFGYADDAGKMVIKASYTKAYPFENGRAKVCKGDKWGYIGPDGKAIVAIEYDNIEDFTDGIARVKKGGKYGYINEDGTVYIKPEYNFIGSFNENGYNWAGKGKTLSQSQKTIFHHDKEILKTKSPYVGFYQVTDSADYTDGCPISSVNGVPKNNDITQNFCRLSLSEQPYIWTMDAGYTQIYDLNGKIVVNRQNGAIGMPKDGYALLRTYSTKNKEQFYKYNYIAADGKSKKLFKKDIIQKINPDDIYETCRPFNNGIALCGNESQSYFIDRNGTTISAMYDKMRFVPGKGYISCRNNLYGLNALDGSEKLTPTYRMITLPRNAEDALAAQDNVTSKYGFIDFEGKTLIPFNFDYATSFAFGKGYVKEGLYYGVVDINGKYLVKNRWADILPATSYDSDFIWVKSPESEKWQCLQISKDRITCDVKADEVSQFDDKQRAIYKQDDMFGAIKPDGSMIIPLRINSAYITSKAIKLLDESNKESMNDVEAYRFNIYNHELLHKNTLHNTVSLNMWDY